MNSYQCYHALGLQEGASIKEVKSAYRKLALQFHPDKNTLDQESTKFKMVVEAYQTLRTEYKNKIGTKSSEKYYEKDSKKKSNFNSKTYSWGARKSDRNPNEDWTRYTRYAENEYQNFWAHYEKTFWDYYEKVRSQTRTETESIQVEDISVSVNVDPGKCIACCSCETIAPSVFRVEKNVKVNPKSKVIDEQGANSEKILDAAQTCPTKAISVSEKESCRRLYPW